MRLRSVRRPRSLGRELQAYRRDLAELTTMIDLELLSLGDLVDALRRRDADPDAAVIDLQAGEEKLDQAAESLRGMLAPEVLHGLHAEYEGSLERALRGIVTAERGCGITRLPYRPPDDEEPLIYWKRGHLNILHARLRMQELVTTLMSWEPGMPAEATVAARLGRVR
ncbi:MAG: hypothetical protein ACXWMN_04215 [Candidatus Limnocylindria bacterium]